MFMIDEFYLQLHFSQLQLFILNKEKGKTIHCCHWTPPFYELLTCSSMLDCPHYVMLCFHNESAHAKGARQYVSNLAQLNIGTMHPCHYTASMQVKY